MNAATASKDLIHAWEFNGLGKAPFQCVGVVSLPSKTLAEHNPDAYRNQMNNIPRGFEVGTCAACGMSLTNNFLIKSADGRQFSVGCDCVKKHGGNGLVEQVKLIKRREAAKARQAQQMIAYQEALEQQRARNGGLTDDEIAEEAKKQELCALDAKMEKVEVLLIDVVRALNLQNGDFVRSVIRQINAGALPDGRARAICCEIYAKHHANKETGKARGKVFDAAKANYMAQAQALFQQCDEILG